MSVAPLTASVTICTFVCYWLVGSLYSWTHIFLGRSTKSVTAARELARCQPGVLTQTAPSHGSLDSAGCQTLALVFCASVVASIIAFSYTSFKMHHANGAQNAGK